MRNIEVIAICIFSLMLIVTIYSVYITSRFNQRKTSFLEKQMRLLARIAKKIGVDPDDVDSVTGGKRRKHSTGTD